MFCLYIIPTTLFFIAKDESKVVAELIESMILYSAAIRMLTQAEITNEMINSANEILNYWAANRENLWTTGSMTFKAHESCHLPKQVKLHGPLSTHSAFAGESTIGMIGKNISCLVMEVSAKQIAERMALRQTSIWWLEKNGSSDVKGLLNIDCAIKNSRSYAPSEDLLQFLSINVPNYVILEEVRINGYILNGFKKAKCNIANHSKK